MTLVEEEMRVGPKGPVVIPKAMRRALKVHPGSKVVFRLEGGRLTLEGARTDAVATLGAIASKGLSVKEVHAHGMRASWRGG